MPYTISKARNRFAFWAAYRAVQAGSAKASGEEFMAALQGCGIVAFAQNNANNNITRVICEAKFHRWVTKAQKILREQYHKSVNYGVVAKLVSVYFKSAFVLSGYHEKPLAFHMPPPIDSKLLEEIDNERQTNLHKRYKWTTLKEPAYKELVAELRTICGEDRPFWELERYWHP